MIPQVLNPLCYCKRHVYLLAPDNRTFVSWRDLAGRLRLLSRVILTLGTIKTVMNHQLHWIISCHEQLNIYNIQIIM